LSHYFAAAYFAAAYGTVQPTEHVIDTGDHPPLRARARQYSTAHKAAISEEVDKYKRAGVARPSQSPWASPVLIVKKKDNSDRMCVDYRALNSVPKKYSFPLPNYRELIDKLAGAKWFSSFDVLWGYHNIPLAKDSIPKTAFISNDELLEFTPLPFGISNAPATFQRMMCTALIGMGQISATYLDDVLVFAGTLEDLLRRMHIILQRLMSVGLKLKPRKCELCTNSVVYLGFNIDAKGVSPIPSKLEIIQKDAARLHESLAWLFWIRK
jgi:hypothetical protein